MNNFGGGGISGRMSENKFSFQNDSIFHKDPNEDSTFEWSWTHFGRPQSEVQHEQNLREHIYGNKPVEKPNVLRVKGGAPKPPSNQSNPHKVLFTQSQPGGVAPRTSSSRSNVYPPQRFNRRMEEKPIRVLDAPNIMDDFYLNILGWSSKNILSIGLDRDVYLWNASTGDIFELFHTELDCDYISSVRFSPDGSYLSVGTNFGLIRIFDLQKNKRIRTLTSHLDPNAGSNGNRVSSLDWNGWMLSSGSRDASAVDNDVRIKNPVVTRYESHTQEVCGLRWNIDGTLLATGGNDNMVNIWRKGYERPITQFKRHQAAVKAIDWCPWRRNVLATGGGTMDRMLYIWDGSTRKIHCESHIGAQLCGIEFLEKSHELITAQGYMLNEVTIWKVPQMVCTRDLAAHTARVLHLAVSPIDGTIATAGADETIRFWRMDQNAPTGLFCNYNDTQDYATRVHSEPPTALNSNINTTEETEVKPPRIPFVKFKQPRFGNNDKFEFGPLSYRHWRQTNRQKRREYGKDKENVIENDLRSVNQPQQPPQDEDEESEDNEEEDEEIEEFEDAEDSDDGYRGPEEEGEEEFEEEEDDDDDKNPTTTTTRKERNMFLNYYKGKPYRVRRVNRKPLKRNRKSQHQRQMSTDVSQSLEEVLFGSGQFGDFTNPKPVVGDHTHKSIRKSQFCSDFHPLYHVEAPRTPTGCSLNSHQPPKHNNKRRYEHTEEEEEVEEGDEEEEEEEDVLDYEDEKVDRNNSMGEPQKKRRGNQRNSTKNGDRSNNVLSELKNIFDDNNDDKNNNNNEKQEEEEDMMEDETDEEQEEEEDNPDFEKTSPPKKNRRMNPRMKKNNNNNNKDRNNYENYELHSSIKRTLDELEKINNEEEQEQPQQPQPQQVKRTIWDLIDDAFDWLEGYQNSWYETGGFQDDWMSSQHQRFEGLQQQTQTQKQTQKQENRFKDLSFRNNNNNSNNGEATRKICVLLDEKQLTAEIIHEMENLVNNDFEKLGPVQQAKIRRVWPFFQSAKEGLPQGFEKLQKILHSPLLHPSNKNSRLIMDDEDDDDDVVIHRKEDLVKKGRRRRTDLLLDDILTTPIRLSKMTVPEGSKENCFSPPFYPKRRLGRPTPKFSKEESSIQQSSSNSSSSFKFTVQKKRIPFTVSPMLDRMNRQKIPPTQAEILCFPRDNNNNNNNTTTTSTTNTINTTEGTPEDGEEDSMTFYGASGLGRRHSGRVWVQNENVGSNVSLKPQQQAQQAQRKGKPSAMMTKQSFHQKKKQMQRQELQRRLYEQSFTRENMNRIQQQQQQSSQSETENQQQKQWNSPGIVTTTNTEGGRDCFPFGNPPTPEKKIRKVRKYEWMNMPNNNDNTTEDEDELSDEDDNMMLEKEVQIPSRQAFMNQRDVNRSQQQQQGVRRRRRNRRDNNFHQETSKLSKRTFFQSMRFH